MVTFLEHFSSWEGGVPEELLESMKLKTLFLESKLVLLFKKTGPDSRELKFSLSRLSSTEAGYPKNTSFLVSMTILKVRRGYL